MLNKIKFRINGFTLKIIACISLICWLSVYVVFGIDTYLNFVLAGIGIAGYPILAFTISEGFLHSSSLKKYIIRLAILAAISELFYDFAMNKFKTPDVFDSQNIVFTLLIGLIGLYYYDLVMMKYKNNKLLMNVLIVLVILSTSVISIIISSEFNYYGVLMIFIMYMFRKDKVSMVLAITAQTVFMGNDLMYFQLLSLPLLLLYSGQEGKKAQKFFYAFYPVILALAGVVAYFVKS